MKMHVGAKLTKSNNHFDIPDMYGTFQCTTEGKLFSKVNGTFTRLGQILCHKINLNKFKKIEII